MWHRDGREESEPIGLRVDDGGQVVVEVPSQRGGVGQVRQERGAGCGDRQNRRPHVEFRHRLQRALRTPVGDGASTGLVYSRLAQQISIVTRDRVVVGVYPLHHHSSGDQSGIPAPASAGTTSSWWTSDAAPVLNWVSFSTIVCPSRVWPQMLMPWWVVGSQVASSTTIGFQPTSHSNPEAATERKE